MVELGTFLVLLTMGYFFGRSNEAKHYRSIRLREQASRSMLVFNTKGIDPTWNVTHATLVSGSTAISVDYFKKVSASLRNFFGGRVSAYESLLDRARREAVLRMKEAARKEGAHVVINMKLETSSISGSDPRRNQVSCVEMYAYGTALKIR